MASTRKKSIWVMAQSTVGTDPDSDGSDYLWVPCTSIGDLTDNFEQLETNYQTGRGHRTVPIAGADGWSVEFETPLIGLSTAAGDGGSPPAVDWLDTLLTQCLGSVGTDDGEGLASATASTFVTDVDTIAEQMLVPVHDSAFTTDKTQWRQVTDNASAPTHSVSPNWDENPAGTGIVYGTRYYQFDASWIGTNHIALVYDKDGVEYTCLDGAVSLSIIMEAGQMAKMRWTIAGTGAKTNTSKSGSSLPAAGNGPAITPIKGTLSPVVFGGTAYATKRIEVDFGLNFATKMATSAATGKNGQELVDGNPSITIEPLFADAVEDLKRDITTGSCIVQFGAGALSGGVLNTCGLLFPHSWVEEVADSDDNNLWRQTVTIRAADGGDFQSSGTNSDLLRFARA